MNLAEALRTGWLEIRSHKMRSFLSFFAISIGVAAMLYTFSQIHGIRKWVSDIMGLMGPGRLEIEKKDGYVSRGLSPGLSSDDAEAIRSVLPDLHMVSPRKRNWSNAFRHRDFNKEMEVIGVTPEWRKREWVYTLRGRFISSEDERRGARVCVLIEPGGWNKKPFWAGMMPERAMAGLLKRRELLGGEVLLGEHLFTVVGIAKEPPMDEDPRWSHSWGGEGTVLVPLSTYQRTLVPQWERDKNPRLVDSIIVDTGSESTVGLYKKKIEALLKARHRGEPDFEVKDFREIMQGMLNNVRKHLIAIIAVGAVAILAGGIGIMNVTLATIFSRVKEIGVRRAVGATRLDILLQFLVEAMTLGLLGGVAGVILGAVGIYSLDIEGGRRGADLQAVHVLLSLLVAVGTGFLFALYPASQAAKLDPVEALHYE